MKVDLSSADKEPLSFDHKLSLPPERLDEDQVAGEMAARISGTARPAAGGYLVEGSIEASGTLFCARCLDPVPWRLEDTFSVEYRAAAVAAEEGELAIEDDELEVAFLAGHELELDDLAAEQIILGLPMRIVCDEACAGLCPRCGANRNREGACRCEPETDERWQALRELAGKSPTN
ncbi:MAG TPA: DUF177 domain-containing protein [Thermoanaerobaculales bacterium]|nr:DUF177 domain-containing protein [Thermoanaerobaculales bacterium]HPA81048.1 DUF177 domain-containing protein [Thermoanaerobaculales bacterium]HQL30676.1 DUF177 domain-containing protein [Thermoanaerobaculales bacterium]HQP44221.1 DUF177 domain-containing protein [Thermoanaerobaculales bacterium]